MPVPILYSFRRCPYAMRARLAIQSSGTQVELREIHLKHKPEHMLEASPKGTVPVLILPCGRVIDESLDVARWALAEADPQGWLAPFEADRETADFLIARNDRYAERVLIACANAQHFHGAHTGGDHLTRTGCARRSDFAAFKLVF